MEGCKRIIHCQCFFFFFSKTYIASVKVNEAVLERPKFLHARQNFGAMLVLSGDGVDICTWYIHTFLDIC